MRDSRWNALLVILPVVTLAVAAGLAYAKDRDVPIHIALALLPAFLIELGLYFAVASERLRDVLRKWPKSRLAMAMTAAAAPSYLVYTIPTGTFDLPRFAAVLGMAAAASYWYLLFGKRAIADAGFLALMASPVLFRVFDDIYPSPAERAAMQTVGIIMWYRTGILTVLALREMDGIGFGLLPRKRDWSAGLWNFLFFLPPGLAAAFLLDFIKPELPVLTWRLALNAVVYFVGTLWFLAVAEEFFFRGLLQQLLSRAMRNAWAGLVLASLIFGSVHLGFRQFPNWRFAILAAIAGLFYGRAYMQVSSIRGAMVTHALVVTLWRVFFL